MLRKPHRIGLVNEVVPASELITRSEAILNQITSNAPLAVQYAMDAVHKGADRDLADALKIEAELFSLPRTRKTRRRERERLLKDVHPVSEEFDWDLQARIGAIDRKINVDKQGPDAPVAPA